MTSVSLERNTNFVIKNLVSILGFFFFLVSIHRYLYPNNDFCRLIVKAERNKHYVTFLFKFYYFQSNLYLCLSNKIFDVLSNVRCFDVTNVTRGVVASEAKDPPQALLGSPLTLMPTSSARLLDQTCFDTKIILTMNGPSVDFTIHVFEHGFGISGLMTLFKNHLANQSF